MTKERPPLSAELALTTIADHIGWPAAAAIVGKKEITLRKWSDPDLPCGISYGAAWRLDAAYMAAGGGWAPFRDTYHLLLEGAAAVALADAQRLAQCTADAAKEAGEATASLVLAAHPQATPATRCFARRQTQEAIAAFTVALPHLCGPEVPPPAPTGAVAGG